MTNRAERRRQARIVAFDVLYGCAGCGNRTAVIGIPSADVINPNGLSLHCGKCESDVGILAFVTAEAFRVCLNSPRQQREFTRPYLLYGAVKAIEGETVITGPVGPNMAFADPTFVSKRDCALDLEAGLNQPGTGGWDADDPVGASVLERGGTFIMSCPRCEQAGRPHPLQVRKRDGRFFVQAVGEPPV
jgi:hypothetical protein